MHPQLHTCTYTHIYTHNGIENGCSPLTEATLLDEASACDALNVKFFLLNLS